MAITTRSNQTTPVRPKKLFIVESCVVEGGEIKERGQEYTPTTAEETYNLIRAGRAIEATDPDVKEVKEEIAAEAKAKAEAAATATVVPKK